MAEDIAISVNDVSKMYKLYDNPMDRLKESLGLSRKKKYKEHYALNHVSFQVHKGETVGIIGTNGSGKSTILKIITGVLSPTAGEIAVNGRISALLELGAGFNMEYTGLENVYLNGTMLGFSEEEINERLQDILDFAETADYSDIEELLRDQAELNMAVAEEGIRKVYGAAVGRTLLENNENDIKTRAKAYAAAASDARMGGCAFPVVVNFMQRKSGDHHKHTGGSLCQGAGHRERQAVPRFAAEQSHSCTYKASYRCVVGFLRRGERWLRQWGSYNLSVWRNVSADMSYYRKHFG